MEKSIEKTNQEIIFKLKKEQRYLQRKKMLANKNLIIGGSLLLLLVLSAVLAPVIVGYDPYEMKVADRLLPPGGKHFLGTDEFGRDLFIRIFYGSRLSIIIGLAVSGISSVMGLIIGLHACYFKALDQLFMRICDGLSAIPGILLAIALMSALGASTLNVIIALTIVYTPSIARIVRAGALAVGEETYIEAVRSQGAGYFRILWLNIAPNILSILLIQATFVFASAILSEASLSFLGVGVPEPQPSWGNILQSSKGVISKAWWMAVFPGLMLVLSVLGLNMTGDGLKDYLDYRNVQVGNKK